MKSKRVGTRVIAWGHLRKLGESAELWLAVNRRFKGIGSSWFRRELWRRRRRSRPNVTTTPTQWKTTSMRPKSKIFTFYRLFSEPRFLLIYLKDLLSLLNFIPIIFVKSASFRRRRRGLLLSTMWGPIRGHNGRRADSTWGVDEFLNRIFCIDMFRRHTVLLKLFFAVQCNLRKFLLKIKIIFWCFTWQKLHLKSAFSFALFWRFALFWGRFCCCCWYLTGWPWTVDWPTFPWCR